MAFPKPTKQTYTALCMQVFSEVEAGMTGDFYSELSASSRGEVAT